MYIPIGKTHLHELSEPRPRSNRASCDVAKLGYEYLYSTALTTLLIENKAPYVKSRRVPCSFLPLLSTSTVTPDLNSTVNVLVKSNFFNQPPDKWLVVFG